MKWGEAERWKEGNVSSLRGMFCRGPRRPFKHLPGSSSRWPPACAPTRLTLPQERKEHGDAAAIGSIGIRAELRRQKSFLHSGLLPHAERDQYRAQHRAHRSDRNTGCQHAGDKPGINRMTHEAVRAGVDDAMAFLVCDRIRPETSEMDPRPPGERDSSERDGGENVDTEVVKLPDRLLSQHTRDPRREQNGAGQNRNAITARPQRHHKFLCPAAPQRDPTPDRRPAPREPAP